MIRITQTLALSAVALALTACNSSDSGTELTPNPPEVGSAELRIHHAASDAPAVNVNANGDILAGLEGVDYQTSSAVLTVDALTYDVTVDGILPDASTATVIDESVTLEDDMRYDIFAAGRLSGEGMYEFGPLILSNEISAVTDGNARLQVLHAVPQDITVDIYLTAFDADISAEQPAATLDYSEDTGQFEVPAGDYQVTITAAGDPNAVVFQSPELSLVSGADLLVAATDSVGANQSEAPIALLLADGEGSSVVYSVTAGADIRVVHAAADAPNVDVHLDQVSAEPAIADLAFGSVAGYVNLPAAAYDVLVTPTGADSVVIEAPVELANASQYSVLAVGELGSDTLTAAVFEDANRRVATEARVRVFHASPAAGEVDIYVTAGEDITDADPAFAGVAFEAMDIRTTGNVPLLPGEYYVTVTPAGSKDAAIGPLMLTLEGGGLYTAVAVDADGGGLPAGLILLDDLASN
ncbi:DUF4397 domain-containing protein [Aliidiomarina sp. Khilg15.8]